MKSTVLQADVGQAGAQWLDAVQKQFGEPGRILIARAHELALERIGDTAHWTGQRRIDHARARAAIVAGLALDATSVAAALLVDVAGDEPTDQAAARSGIDAGVFALAGNVARLAPIQLLGDRGAARRRTSERTAQLEAIRKMLLAMVEDIRAVLIKLADQLQTLRYLAVHGDVDARSSAAQNTLDLFAPLANRLGVWQLKWELEDLAFRCTDPDTYRTIARDVDEKRADRESYIANVMTELGLALKDAGIKAEISGRPKHIYSIWKKMQRKGLRFEQREDNY